MQHHAPMSLKVLKHTQMCIHTKTTHKSMVCSKRAPEVIQDHAQMQYITPVYPVNIQMCVVN